jgi:hypothetical protein
MSNDSYTQQALALDPNFQTRVRSCLSNVAWQVITEAENVPKHAERAAFARSVINNVDNYARQYAPWLVTRTNVNAFATSYNFQAGAVVTAAGDADIESQLHTDWNDIAGIDPTAP